VVRSGGCALSGVVRSGVHRVVLYGVMNVH